MVFIKYLNNKLSPVLIFFLLIITMLFFPNKYTITLSPIINLILIIYVFKDEIKNYDYNEFINNPKSPNRVWNTLMFVIVGQTLLNTIMQYGFHLNPPSVEFALKLTVAPAVSIIFSSIVEEVVYRKLLFKYFEGKFNFWIGATISSLLFMISHYNYVFWPGFFAAGFAWCWFYKKYNNLAINITSHMIINFVFFLTYTIKFN